MNEKLEKLNQEIEKTEKKLRRAQHEESRIRVPKDVSVIGCDDIFYSGIRRLSLTTIDHFVALKGRDACDIIIRKIAINDQFYTGLQPTSIYNIEYTPKLIARKTTAYANTKKRK